MPFRDFGIKRQGLVRISRDRYNLWIFIERNLVAVS
jgi:hypothetical protein